MLITDSQVHIWAADTPERPWPADHMNPHRPIPFSKEDLLKEMDSADVHRAVIVPPSWEGDRNDLALEAARQHPERFAVMGRLDVEAPESRGRMATWRQEPGMMGVRLTFKHPKVRGVLAERGADWLWDEAEKAGVPLMVLIDTDQIDFIDEVAERHPELKLVLDHLCLPSGMKDDEAFKNLGEVLAVAKRPNIAVKSTALPRYTTDAYPFRRVHPYIRRAYDAFGPKRMFWGTDLTSLQCSYAQAVTTFSEEMPWLSEEDKDWIMGRAVSEWLGWPHPDET